MEGKICITKSLAEEKVVPAAVVPTPVFAHDEVAPCFYHWREVYPELELLINNIEVIKKEAVSIGQVSWAAFM